jgi:hypothetical protein
MTDNWTVKFEYLFADFEKATRAVAVSATSSWRLLARQRSA